MKTLARVSTRSHLQQHRRIVILAFVFVLLAAGAVGQDNTWRAVTSYPPDISVYYKQDNYDLVFKFVNRNGSQRAKMTYLASCEVADGNAWKRIQTDEVTIEVGKNSENHSRWDVLDSNPRNVEMEIVRVTWEVQP